MRVERYFGFVDLSGFTAFIDTHDDEQAVEILSGFRAVAREVGSDFGVRIAKWLGDGCMFVAVDPRQLVVAVCELDQQVDQTERIPLKMHAGLAGGSVILLEGDDYIGGAVNLASRLCDASTPESILATPELAPLAPSGVITEPAVLLSVAGFRAPIEVVRFCRKGKVCWSQFGLTGGGS